MNEEQMEYEVMFKAGVDRQRDKMIEHEDESDGWDCVDMDHAIAQIEYNLELLKEYNTATNLNRALIKDGVTKLIMDKSANIANYAHMIIYRKVKGVSYFER